MIVNPFRRLQAQRWHAGRLTFASLAVFLKHILRIEKCQSLYERTWKVNFSCEDLHTLGRNVARVKRAETDRTGSETSSRRIREGSSLEVVAQAWRNQLKWLLVMVEHLR